MAVAGGSAAAVAAAQHASSYRVKFTRREFLRLVEIAKPRIIYHRRKRHFFACDGFVMYIFDCYDSDFTPPAIEAIEFSNYRWSE